MVKLRFYAAGGPKDCLIEESSDGGVLEHVGNAPRAGSKAAPRRKTKAHPANLVNGKPTEYIQSLVEAKLKEGYVVISDADESAAERLHLVIKTTQPLSMARAADVLVSFGVPSPILIPQNDAMPTMQLVVEGVEVSVQQSGTATVVTAIAGKNSAIIAALFLCRSKDEAQATYGDGSPANLNDIVKRALEESRLSTAIGEVLIEQGVMARPFNVSQLQRPERRSRFQMSL